MHSVLVVAVVVDSAVAAAAQLVRRLAPSPDLSRLLVLLPLQPHNRQVVVVVVCCQALDLPLLRVWPLVLDLPLLTVP
jgi:hypothetical protein